MQGALIMVVYGNPSSDADPVLSIRTTMEEHHPPLPLPEDYAVEVKTELADAKWTPIDDLFRAELNFVVYNVTRWPGTSVEANTTTRPWIWAHNPSQPFEAHRPDASLEMHNREMGVDYGFFFTDMKLSESKTAAAPNFPSISEDERSFGASSDASLVAASSVVKATGFRHRAWQVHGLLLTVAYFIIYPLGVVLLRRSSDYSFKLHWITQVCATALMLIGALLGIYLHPEIEHLHQLIGLALIFSPVVQILLGWRHHIVYLRISRSTMFSEAHILLGRVLMGLGAFNVLLGMVLKHWSAWAVLLIALIGVVEACGLAFLLLRVHKPRRGQKYAQLNVDDHDGAFALEEVASPIEDDDDDDNSSEKEMPLAHDHKMKSDED